MRTTRTANFAIIHWNGAARFLEKRSVPTVRLHAPQSGEDAVSHDYNPDADEAVLADARPNTQTFTLREGRQDVIGELSPHSHA